MKGVIRNVLLVGTMALMSACPTMTTVAERETYAELKWYAKCKQIGSRRRIPCSGLVLTMFMRVVKVCLGMTRHRCPSKSICI